MALHFILIVNDGGELKTVTSTELDAWAAEQRDDAGRTSGLSDEIDVALNYILDARAVAAGDYDPSDNDTPIVVTIGEPS